MNDEVVAKLAALLAHNRVTLRYAVLDAEHNHALADYLRDHRKGIHGHYPA